MGKREITKQHIIEKAAPIFNKKGYSGTSLSDLVQSTGLTKGSIYGNFKNKEEVALESFHYNTAQLRAKFRDNLKTAPKAIDKLHSYLSTYREIYSDIIIWGGCPIANASADSDDTNKALHEAVQQFIEEWHASLHNLVQKAAEEGDLTNKEPQEVAYQMISLIEGAALMGKATNNRAYFDSAIDLAEKLLR